MSKTEAKPTPGPCIVGPVTGEYRHRLYCDDGRVFIAETSGHGGHDADERRAEVMADAFNVYTETGLTPRELAEQRDELMKALVHCHDAILAHQTRICNPGWFEGERLEAKAALAKTEAK